MINLRAWPFIPLLFAMQSFVMPFGISWFVHRFCCAARVRLLGCLVALACALPTASQAAPCTFTINSLAVTPASSVGAAVTATAVLQYKDCQAVGLAIKDNAPANLSYANCSVGGADWNCASVATASGVTTSTFTPGNNGQKTETVSFTYAASVIGCPSLTMTPVIGGASGTARASTCSAAPSVTTGSATATSSTSATFNGTVASNGVAVTSISFKYGTASGVYGTTVAATPSTLAANAAVTAVSKTVSGLTCGTTYFYRATATNATGTTDGPEQSFKACFSLTKVASNSNAPVGTNFDFTLTAANATGSTISNVVVTDDVSLAGLNYGGCTTATGTCTASGSVVTWAAGNVATGSSPTATITVQAATAGAKTNTATANTTGSPVATSIVNAYAPLADWRMDEASWNGTAGEVKDSTGNGYNGRARIAAGATAVASTSSVAPVAYSSGGRSTCGYGDFDRASGPTRTNTYVELTGIPPLPTSFTFAAWIRTTDAAQSGQRILVRDDADNGWGFSMGDGGTGKIRLFNRNIGFAPGTLVGDGSIGCGNGPPFCLDTKAVVTSNSWFFVAVAIDTSAKLIAHYVFNSAGTLLSSTRANFTGTWVDGTGLASLGGETIASSEGRTSSFHVKGNIDEVQIYQGVLSQTDVNLLRTRSRTCVGSGPDHVELVHNGAALTCSPKAVKVLGCTTAASCNSTVADQFVGDVTFTPTAISGAQWCADALCTTPLAGSITVASGSTIYLREPTARTDTMAGTTSGALTLALQCFNTATSSFGTNAAACNVAFAGAGFLVNVPNHVSCTAQTVTLQAVQSSATGNTCVPAFSGVNRNVSLYSGYTNPSTGTKTASLNYVTTSGGATSAVAALSVSSGSPSTLTNLYFDNTGTARLTGFSYPDVGQVTLFPTYAGSAATNDTGLSLGAVSGNSFISAPKSFTLTPSGPYVAGQLFLATAMAMNNCAAVTPNFGKETAPETVELKAVTSAVASASNSQLTGPAGGVTGSLTPGAFTLAKCSPASAGSVCDTALAWTEVGDLTLSAALKSGNYLASGVSPAWGSAAAGAFKPAYLTTELDTAQPCGTFTYSGQPFRIKVTAMNASGGTTANYTDSYARAVTLGSDSAGACTPSTTGFSNNTLAASDFPVVAVAANLRGFASTAPVTNTATPLPISYMQALAALATVAVCARDEDGVNSHGMTQASLSIRNGRLRMSNVFGSVSPLQMPVEAQYWTGLSWVKNTDDGCTSLAAIPFNYDTAGWPVPTAGAGFITIVPPGNGSRTVTADLTALPWLRSKWAGSAGYDQDPSAQATFGVYSPEHKRTIHIREAY